MRVLDGNYHKIAYVDGFAGKSIHIGTKEGRSFWARKDDGGRYYEVDTSKE